MDGSCGARGLGEAEDELFGDNAMNEFELNETIAHVRIEENKKECM